MVFSINELKEELRDSIRVYLYPNNTITDTEIELSNDSTVFKVAQEFTPYCKFYNTITPYKYTIPVDVKLRKYGTPDGDVIVSIQSSSNNEPSGTTIGHCTIDVDDITSGSFSVNSGSIRITNMLGSNTKYFLSIEPQCSSSTVDYYSTQKSTTNNYIIGSLNIYDGSSWNATTGDMYFNITPVSWIFTDYPRDQISKYNFPRMAIDAISRRVNQRWINKEIAEYTIDFTIVVYSSYPNELDDILSYVDRSLFKERANFTNIKLVSPTELTPVVVIRDNLFSRALRYGVIYKMTNT